LGFRRVRVQVVELCRNQGFPRTGRTVIQAKAIKGSDVGSVHNPTFVAAQHKRDEEAEKDLEILKHLKEARREKAAAKPVKQ